MTLREFSEMYYNAMYKNIPVHARPNKQFKEGSANELTKSVLAWLEFNGIKAWRSSSEGRYLPEKRIKNVLGQSILVEKGKFIPRSKAGVGMGDISSLINKKFVSWEIKFGKDRQSDVQKKFEKEIVDAGAEYYIIKNWEGFMYLYQQCIAKKDQ